MNCTYTVNHKKMTAHLCHNIGKSRSIFTIFSLFKQDDDDEISYFTVRWKTRACFVYRAKKFLNMYEKCPPHQNMLRCENKTPHFILL